MPRTHEHNQQSVSKNTQHKVSWIDRPAVMTGVVAGIAAVAMGAMLFAAGCGTGSQEAANDAISEPLNLSREDEAHATTSRQETLAVYFDTSTGKTVLVAVTPGTYASPLVDNADAFRCAIFSCTECSEITGGMTVDDLEAAGMYIGYLSRDPPRPSTDSPLDLGMMSEEICSVEDLKWFSMGDGDAFVRLQRSAVSCDDGSRANICRP